MELKEGMYVRTEHGEFTKIESFYIRHEEAQEYVISFSNGSSWRGYLEDLKASYNIIDLTEVGDYINGCRVEEHAHEKGRLFVTYTYIGGKGFTTYEDYSWELTKDREEDIKSIVTKEQFESMSYKVGD